MKNIYTIGFCLSTIAMPLNAANAEQEDGLVNIDEFDYATMQVDWPVKNDYPPREVLFSIFNELKRQDAFSSNQLLKESLMPDGELLITDDLLKYTYDWAYEHGLIELSDVETITSEIKPNEFDYFANKALFHACGVGALECIAGGAVGIVSAASLPCLAAAVEQGLNPMADGWCATSILTFGGAAVAACIGELNGCRDQPDPTVVAAGYIGSTNSSNKTNGKCGANGRVFRIEVKTRDHKVARLKAHCTDGTNFEIGKGGVSTTSPMYCDNNNMVSGIYARAGDKIDYVSMYCDDIPDDGTKYDYVPGYGGGGGSTRRDMKCPDTAGHLYGIDAYETEHLRKSSRHLKYLKPLCKQL